MRLDKMPLNVIMGTAYKLFKNIVKRAILKSTIKSIDKTWFI